MDLRRLQLFLAVADHGGFTAGAAAVHTAQPAVSLAVRELEAELGAQLFVRTRQGARLTPAGEALVGPAREALRAVEVAAAAVAGVTGLVAGHLDVAALPTLAADPLAGLVGAFRSAHPEVTVRVVATDDPAELHEAVRTGSAEVGITEEGATGALPALPLLHQDLVAISPPGTAARKGAVLGLHELAGLDLVVTAPGSSLRALVDRGLAEVGETVRVGVETEQRDALVPLVLAGAGTAVVPPALARSAAALGAVVRPLRPRLQRAVVVVHRPSPSPAARAFLDSARPG